MDLLMLKNCFYQVVSEKLSHIETLVLESYKRGKIPCGNREDKIAQRILQTSLLLNHKCSQVSSNTKCL